MKVIIPLLLLASTVIWAADTQYPKAKVSFEDFAALVREVEPHRADRLLDLDAFLAMSKEPGVIILDSRSAFRFERIHLKGAKHLAFTDFTQANLARVIPSFDTKILIYCNNNFKGNQIDFASKVASPRPKANLGMNAIKVAPILKGASLRSMVDSDASKQLAAQDKPRMMALNVPTYIHLYGYGYRNVYELNELVNVGDPRVQFEGTTVDPKSLPLPGSVPAAK